MPAYQNFDTTLYMFSMITLPGIVIW